MSILLSTFAVECDPSDFEFDIDDKHDKAKKYAEVHTSQGIRLIDNYL